MKDQFPNVKWGNSNSSDLQRQYDDFANAELQRLHLCRCPYGCGQNCLRIHGYYARNVEARGEVHRVRIMRLSFVSFSRFFASFSVASPSS